MQLEQQENEEGEEEEEAEEEEEHQLDWSALSRNCADLINSTPPVDFL